jgi:hypothetical protein
LKTLINFPFPGDATEQAQANGPELFLQGQAGGPGVFRHGLIETGKGVVTGRIRVTGWGGWEAFGFG